MKFIIDFCPNEGFSVNLPTTPLTTTLILENKLDLVQIDLSKTNYINLCQIDLELEFTIGEVLSNDFLNNIFKNRNHLPIPVQQKSLNYLFEIRFNEESLKFEWTLTKTHFEILELMKEVISEHLKREEKCIKKPSIFL